VSSSWTHTKPLEKMFFTVTETTALEMVILLLKLGHINPFTEFGSLALPGLEDRDELSSNHIRDSPNLLDHRP